MGLTSMRSWGARAAAAAAVSLLLAALAACTASEHLANNRPEAQASAPQTPPPPPPPPTDLAGRWKLTAASGGACLMNFAGAAAAAQGPIAPEGGCPGNFFTSRKWTFERDALIIRNHKGEPLAQLSFAAGHFEGRETNGAAVMLSR